MIHWKDVKLTQMTTLDQLCIGSGNPNKQRISYMYIRKLLSGRSLSKKICEALRYSTMYCAIYKLVTKLKVTICINKFGIKGITVSSAF